MTPRWVVYRFLRWLDFLGGQCGTPFSQEIPKIAKKGVPSFCTNFFSKVSYSGAHFFSKIGDNMVWRGDTLLKNWSKGGYPLFGLFLAIWGISGEKGVPYRPPRESKPAEKTVHHPSGVISEVLPSANLGPRHARSTKLAGRTSKMTPEGWCTVFSAGLDSLEIGRAHV